MKEEAQIRDVRARREKVNPMQLLRSVGRRCPHSQKTAVRSEGVVREN